MRLRPVLMTCAAMQAFVMVPSGVAAGKSETFAAAKKPRSSRMSPKEIADVRASVRRVIAGIDIPYEEFTLPNGLRTLVHTDRSAPTVFVSVWYDVASKHEQPGRSGFAHLFEHLMFNGSENVPGDYLPRLLSIGADVNGSTSQDRTNYYQTVPTSALDLAMFMESDRMGHLLGALNQASLDEQRGVVQNEKRSGDGPTSIVGHMERRIMYPAPHPYDHSVIGSMADLNAATLDDVRAFFKEHYGPNNATLILAGDIDLETARRLVTKYFASIPAGPRNVRPTVQSVPLSKTVRETVTAPITTPIILREWRVPGAYSKDALTLDAVAETMTGSPEAPMVKRLVRELKLFQGVRASNSTSAHGGEFSISGRVRPGVDAKVAAAALDNEIAQYLKRGTSDDLLTRWVARYTNGVVRGMEIATSRGKKLGEDLMVYGNPMATKANLLYYAALTPTTVDAAAHRWLDRPRYELAVTPGPRVTPAEDVGIDGTTATPNVTAAATAPVPSLQLAAIGSRGPLPIVGPASDAKFPAVEHATLANGIPVLYARAGAIPYTSLNITIDGGTKVEPADQTGTMAAMYGLLNEGFGKLDEDAIRQRTALLGISLGASAGPDLGSLSLDVPNANLAQGLTMFRQMLSQPTFPNDAIERWQRGRLDGLAASRLSPDTLTRQELLPLIDGGSPYNRAAMYGDAAIVRRTDRAAVLAAFHRWVRPERAKLIVVSTRPLSGLLPELNRTLGTWKASTPLTPLPKIDYTAQPGKPQIVLIDLPGTVTATVTGGQMVSIDDTAPGEAIAIAKHTLGAGFTSRINMNLRENKHWSYGAAADFDRKPMSSRFIANTNVQQDKVGPAIAEITNEVRDILSNHPITQAEFDAAKATGLGQAASMYASRYGVSNGLDEIRRYNRADDYPGKLSERARAVTLADANGVLQAQLDPSKWVWVITGNAKLIRPQLDELGLPVRVVEAKDVLPSLK